MNQEQLEKMRDGRGFIAALDQSGGSTPNSLKKYGIDGDAYSNDEEMFRLMHEMRSRIMKSPAFDGDRILGAILFEDTMNRQIATQTLGITTTNLLDAAGHTLATIRIGTNGSWNTLSQAAYDVVGTLPFSFQQHVRFADGIGLRIDFLAVE